MKPLTIKNLFLFSFEKIKIHRVVIFTAVLIFMTIAFAGKVLGNYLDTDINTTRGLLYMATLFGIALIESIVVINVIKQGLVIVRGGTPDLKALLDIPSEWLRYVIGSTIVNLFVVLGFLFLIIPGFFALAFLIFTLPLIVDKQLNPFEALTLSFKTVSKNWKGMMALVLVSGLLNLVGMMFFFVGLFLTIPLTFFMFLRTYDLLFNRESKPLDCA